MQVTLNERAYQYIRKMLVEGKLIPGQRLVTRVLAKQIGVSLAPVREALQRLSSEGLIEHLPGAGAFVREQDRQELLELWTLREAIESSAASEAAKFADEDQLEELNGIVSEFEQIAASIKVHPQQRATRSQFAHWLRNDERFHEVLMEAARNRLLAKVIGDYRAISAVFEAQSRDPSLLTYSVSEQTLRSHTELLEALRRRDSEQARKLMCEQIRKGRKTLLSHLRQSASGRRR